MQLSIFNTETKAPARKQFYEICSIDATNSSFEQHGYRVINFATVKSEIMAIFGNGETAIEYHTWNNITDPGNTKMLEIKRQLENLVFKESRGNSQYRAIGWETAESYLRYHSGIIYKWYSKHIN